jgi:hypothetical protein
MKRKAFSIVCATMVALGLIVPVSASAGGNGVSGCHADLLHFYKGLAGTNSAEATADFFGVSVKTGQEIISGMCGQS